MNVRFVYLATGVLFLGVLIAGWYMSPYRSALLEARDQVETVRRLSPTEFESLIDESRVLCDSCLDGQVLHFGYDDAPSIPSALERFRFERVDVTPDTLEGRITFVFDSGVFARVQAEAGTVLLIRGDTSETEEVLYRRRIAEPGATDNLGNAQ